MADRTGLRHRPALRATAVAAFLGLFAFTPVAPARAQTGPAPPSPYIGASACRDCHAAEHESWARSKHARAYTCLSEADAASDACLGCHATGVVDDLRAANGQPMLPGTQCEACHGPGRLHAEAATASAQNARALGKTLKVKPDAGVCERCHNRQSPRFQGFVYAPMARLVHAHPVR